MTSNDEIATARRAIGLLDLTNLDDDCDSAAIEGLCQRAMAHRVAAVCVWPRFVAQAVHALGESAIKVCTVVNFPSGREASAEVLAQVQTALADGADEIDLVLPYPALIAGDLIAPVKLVAAVRDEMPTDKQLKVIVESGELATPTLIAEASRIAIQAGADFVKTSTGKVATNATLQAARVMLDAIAASDRKVGFKAAGGIRTTADAMAYIALAEQIMGVGWVCAEHFRLGASGLLDQLLTAANQSGCV